MNLLALAVLVFTVVATPVDRDTNSTGGLIAQLKLEQNTFTCGACKDVLTILRTASRNLPRSMALRVVEKACTSGLLAGFCQNFLNKVPGLSGTLGLGTDFLDAIEIMDTQGQDGAYFCHFLLGSLCPIPEFRAPDVSTLIPAKRENLPPLPESTGGTFKALHISDIHLQNSYVPGAPGNCVGMDLGGMCCYNGAVQMPGKPIIQAPEIGYYYCDTPPLLLENALANAAVNQSDYDFSIFTGDAVDHGLVFLTKEEMIQEEIDTFTSLKRNLNNIPTYPVLGNHDSWPYAQDPTSNLKASDRYQYNRNLMEYLWSDGWLDSDAIDDVRHHDTAYSVMAKDNLKIIALNTNFWYRFNLYNYNNLYEADTSGMFQFLVDELDDCEQNGKFAWIIGHVPPGGLPDDAVPVQTWVFTQIVERYNDNIAALFFGHTHQDEFTVMYAGDGTAKTIENAINTVWVAPSITPLSEYNPSWRYYVVDDKTYQVMDSVTYYGDISSGSQVNWQFEYSARETYTKYFDWDENAPLNGQFWHQVSTGIRDDPRMAQEYSSLQYRRTNYAPLCHDENCRMENYCYTSSFNTINGIKCRSGNSKLSKRTMLQPSVPMPRPERKDKHVA